MSNPLLKLTPLHSVSQQFNPRLTEHQGWELAESYTTLETELNAARQKVAIADATPNGKLTVQGNQAQDFLSTAMDLPQIAVNSGAIVMGISVYRLRSDLFFMSTLAGKEEVIQEKLKRTSKETDKFITITDVTHGRSEILVVGPVSQELLSKLCGLDFHPCIFSNDAAKQSNLVKTTQLIIRRDIGHLPAFHIIGARSLGEYLWRTIIEAGREWNLIPIGQTAINRLLEQSTKKGG